MKMIRKAVGAAALLALVLSGSGAAARAGEWPSEQNYIITARGSEERWQVQMLQYLLRAQGYDIAVDGRFGQQTEAVLKRFQKRSGLKETGVARDADWKAMISTLRRGDQGNSVRALQVGLNRFIHEHTNPRSRPIPVDGKFGALTEKWLLQSKGDGPGRTPIADGSTWFDLIFDEH